MNLLKRFLNFILFGNLFVSAGASCLIISTEIQVRNTRFPFEYALIVFFASLFIYNLQRVFYKKHADTKLNTFRREWISENQQSIVVLTIIGFIGVVVTFYFNNFKIIYYLSPLLLISLAYFIPFIQFRKYIWLKLIILSSVWTFVTAVVPILLNTTPHSTQEILIHTMSRFCFMIAICIPFDIRDMEIDKVENIQTLSQKLGVPKTRLIALGFMVLSLVLIGTEFLQEMISLKITSALFLSGMVTTILIILSKPERKEYFFLLGIDGTMLLQGLLLMLANVI